MALKADFVSPSEANAQRTAALSGGSPSEPDAATGEGQQKSKAKVFISYSRKDMAFADRLETALKARGFEPLIDRTDIYAFEEWWKRIEALIVQADTVVFVLSPDAVRPGTVALKEVAFAASLNKRFAPIVFRAVEDKSVPEELAKLNFIFFDDPARFEASADRLTNALHTDIGWIRQHTEYGEAERRWSALGRPSGLLLHSPTLEVAEHWIASRPRDAPDPTEEIRSFVAASRRAARSAQRLRRIVQASMFTLLIGIILGLVAWINQSYLAQQWRWYTLTRPYMVSQVRPYVLSAAKEQALKPGASFKECATNCPEMIVVPAGSFTIGTPASEPGHQVEEGSQHSVTIAKPFAVSKYELTFDAWDACVAYGSCDSDISDAAWGRALQPVINVTWYDARRYVQWLAAMTGKPYRLISEAEYEFAARAGTQTVYPWGDEIGTGNANCKGCGGRWDNRALPVGSFAPNKFGLYDMIGNVYSWCEDCAHPSYTNSPDDGSAWIGIDPIACTYRVVRGGSWGDSPNNLRAGRRGRYAADARINIIGFRVARTIEP
jgi:formylglycine-generating enzyme required for sulfatase activity